MSVCCVFGTRPEAIKMAPVVAELQRRPDLFRTVVCVTGQHRELLDDVLAVFGIVPDESLSVMAPNQDLAGLTARILQGVDEVLVRQAVDYVLVQGDTTTAFVAALAAFYRRIPVGHVEAGLRSHDLSNPFPEEANRALVDRFADLMFAPTEANRDNLLAEGVAGTSIEVTGNTGIDALLAARAVVTDDDRRRLATTPAMRAVVADPARPLALVTAHRRESFGAPLERMFSTLSDLARRYPDWHFVYPVHPNPNVAGPAGRLLGGIANFDLVAPMSYRTFVAAMDRADLILTDSGGVQEEAPSLGKPVIVMRAVTERQEAVDAGTVLLAGNDGPPLERTALPFLADPRRAREWPVIPNPYGDGQAAGRIVSRLVTRLGLRA